MIRKYQADIVDRALAALEEKGSAVLQMPTGSGKTRTAAEIIKRSGKNVWFICHRQEIERQASVAFTAAGIEHGIVSPRAKPDYDKPVQIVSVATLARRMTDLPLPALAIWDECHHVAAKSWARIREALSDSQNLGLTATPERLDGKGLAEWFDELVVGPSTRELIDGGWLSDFRYFAPSDPDLAKAKMQAGDYKKGDLDKVMNTPVLIGDAIAEYKKNADGKRALVFCASVEASKALVDRFNAEGIPARHVDGTTLTAERDAAVEALASGEIKVLSNVEVFTEGFDLPAIDAVILLRPTKSLALFLQMIGRALRRAQGKDEALIFDHAGLWRDHDWFDLPIEWSLDGGARQRRLAGRKHGPRRCPECKEVRLERAEVCACGYEFPTRREIGEYDGVLRELRGVVPEGWETSEDFARRFGVSNFVVKKWRLRGMPSEGTLVHIEPSLSWLSDNVDIEATKMFSARRKKGTGEFLSVNAFAKKHGFSSGYAWVEKGLPVSEFGVPVEEGGVWLEDYMSRNYQHAGRTPVAKDGTLSSFEFSKRAGVHRSLVTRLARRGMPRTANGRVNWDDAIAWIREQDVEITNGKVTPFWVDNAHEYESHTEFAKRVGRDFGTMKYYLPKGLRALSLPQNGWIHIQRGLEWVRDNTNIEIPPEAWPACNDNAALDRAA